MKPEKQPKIPQEDLFRMRLENMLDINHELIKLSKHIDCESPDKEWGALFVSTKGAPAIRTRLIAGLHYLKHLHDLSDEQVVKGWTENPYWQYFCGEEYFQHKMPIHPVTMTKWHNLPGKSSSEKLLIETIKAGLKSKTIKPGSLKKVTQNSFFISGQKRGVTRSIKKALKQRSVIEPEIGHMKNDGRLGRWS